MAGIGPKGAASLLGRYGPIEAFSAGSSGAKRRDLALLFKKLATLRTDAALFSDVEEVRWRGPAEGFTHFQERLGDPRLLARVTRAAQKLQ